jgi:hypothetical protein
MYGINEISTVKELSSTKSHTHIEIRDKTIFEEPKCEIFKGPHSKTSHVDFLALET